MTLLQLTAFFLVIIVGIIFSSAGEGDGANVEEDCEREFMVIDDQIRKCPNEKILRRLEFDVKQFRLNRKYRKVQAFSVYSGRLNAGLQNKRRAISAWV